MDRSTNFGATTEVDRALLPWKTIPTWLRFLRVLIFAALAVFGLTWAGEFAFQVNVMTSPDRPTGEYNNPVEFKGKTTYLSHDIYEIWTVLDSAMLPSGFAGFGLIIANSVIERRIKARRWNSQLTVMIDHMDRDRGRPD